FMKSEGDVATYVAYMATYMVTYMAAYMAIYMAAYVARRIKFAHAVYLLVWLNRVARSRQGPFARQASGKSDPISAISPQPEPLRQNRWQHWIQRVKYVYLRPWKT